MSTRERWIVYPLLFMTLGIAMRDKVVPPNHLGNLDMQFEAGAITTPQVQCSELRVGRVVCERLESEQVQSGQSECQYLVGQGSEQSAGRGRRDRYQHPGGHRRDLYGRRTVPGSAPFQRVRRHGDHDRACRKTGVDPGRHGPRLRRFCQVARRRPVDFFDALSLAIREQTGRATKPHKEPPGQTVNEAPLRAGATKTGKTNSLWFRKRITAKNTLSMSRIATSQFEPEGPNRCMRSNGAFWGLWETVISMIGSPPVSIPLFVLVVATAIFRFTDADMALVRWFFVGGAPEHWPLMEAYPWKELYDWGIVPAWILGCGGLLVWIVSFVWAKLESWRDAGLYFCLLLLLGPGLLVNGVLKPHWGRPRPNNVETVWRHASSCRCWSWGMGRTKRRFPAAMPRWAFTSWRRPLCVTAVGRGWPWGSCCSG